MPLYVYRCVDEDVTAEISQAHDAEALTACPDCGGPVRRVLGEGLQITPSSMPNRTEQHRNAHPPTPSDPAWEKGQVFSHRPDGTVMPFLDNDGLQPLTQKELANRGGSGYLERTRRSWHETAPATP